MSDRVLLVDLKNVQKVDLSKVPDDVRVLIFYGLRQKKLPEELVVQAQPLGTRLQWIKIAGQKPNALDFHIAYYLGKTLTERPQAHCAVLSKDKGFDPLIRHLHGLDTPVGGSRRSRMRFRCQRIRQRRLRSRRRPTITSGCSRS